MKKLIRIIKEHERYPLTLRVFFILCVAMSVFLIALFSYSYCHQVQDHQTSISLQESHVVALLTQEIEQQFVVMYTDIEILSQLNELKTYVQTGDEQLLSAVASEFQLVAQAKPYYMQLRFLDAAGIEKVRIDRVADRAYRVDASRLQDKSGREYFQQGIRLSENGVYFSRLDLNVEFCQIVEPHQPTIRAVIPVYGENHESPRGIVVLNYDGQRIVELLERMEQISSGSLLLIDQEGYWIRGLTREDEWGFVLPDRRNKRFSNRFVRAWPHINDRQGTIRTEQGDFSYNVIAPQLRGTITNPPHWYVISYIPDQLLSQFKIALVEHQFNLGVVLLLLGLLPTWIVSMFIAEVLYKHHDLKMRANYDRLTGLANRSLFDDRLQQLLWHSEHGNDRFAVLYCDLDGFKTVNDTLGHDAGDEVLRVLGRRMNSLVRKTDTVARMGGDEMAILLANITGREVAEMIAAKIIDQVSRPIPVKNGVAQVGVSIGIGLYPEHATDGKALITCADQAMYEAKKRGKGRYCSYEQIENAPDCEAVECSKG
jgi:diguanylate cyclase (GGDEF)-like protein